MDAIFSIDGARAQAARRLPRLVYEFIAGGAEDEVTLRANRRAFERVALRPQVLAGAAERGQATTVLGEPISLPVVIGPTGLPRLAGAGGDLAGARAAERCGTVFTHSCMGSHTLEQTAEAAGGPLWFQLYLWRERKFVDELVRRAQAVGYRALVVTLDVQVNGKRERDLRNGFTVPPKLRPRTAFDLLRHPLWLGRVAPHVKFADLEGSAMAPPGKTVAHAKFINDVLSNPGAAYEELERLREVWRGPIVVKGILTGEDAERVVACGVDALVVSNHGGRQLDGAPATLDVLPEVVAAVGGRAEVYLDSGIRRGTDVVKALALGARAVLIGRPWLYGLASGGEAGVVRVLEILHEEIDRTLALLGRRSIDELDASVVAFVDEVHERSQAAGAGSPSA